MIVISIFFLFCFVNVRDILSGDDAFIRLMLNSVGFIGRLRYLCMFDI